MDNKLLYGKLHQLIEKYAQHAKDFTYYTTIFGEFPERTRAYGMAIVAFSDLFDLQKEFNLKPNKHYLNAKEYLQSNDYKNAYKELNEN